MQLRGRSSQTTRRVGIRASRRPGEQPLCKRQQGQVHGQASRGRSGSSVRPPPGPNTAHPGRGTAGGKPSLSWSSFLPSSLEREPVSGLAPKRTGISRRGGGVPQGSRFDGEGPNGCVPRKRERFTLLRRGPTVRWQEGPTLLWPPGPVPRDSNHCRWGGGHATVVEFLHLRWPRQLAPIWADRDRRVLESPTPVGVARITSFRGGGPRANSLEPGGLVPRSGAAVALIATAWPP